MLRRRTYATFVAMWAVLGVTIAIALACGPAASPAATNQASPATPTATIWWLGDTPSPSEFATLEAMPTPTPYPPGYVKPTDPPHSPPLTDAEIRATLGASIATEEAQWARSDGFTNFASGSSAETPTPQPTPTPVPLTTQVTQFVRNGGYDVVARVRAGASHKVSVPHDIWTAATVPLAANWDGLVRTSITKVTAYRGALASDYKLTSPPHLPNVPLDIGAEYIIFIKTSFAKAADDGVCSTQRPVASTALCYNQAQLNAVGGVGGWYDGRQAWIIDGALARRIPRPHFLSRQPVSDLSAARAGGESLTLLDLEAAIRQGLRQYRRD